MQPEEYGHLSRSDSKTTYDAGLRTHMGSIYNRMAAGVLITAITSYIVGTNEQLFMLLMGGPQAYLFMFAPLAIIWFGFNPETTPSSRLKVMFGLLSVIYGVTFSVIAVMATGNPDVTENVARALFITVAMFAGISLFGYTTKKDLGAMMTFCVMAVIGVLLLTIVGMIFPMPGFMDDLISVVAILAFSGITAWQVQDAKRMYHASNGEEANSRMAWGAALTLYIAFVAIFSHLFSLLNNND